MDTLRYLRRLFRYDAWANRETLRSLQAASAPPERALKLMNHILAAEWLWYARIAQLGQPMAVWPELGLEQCETHLADLERVWQNYLAELTPSRLEQPMAYKNTRGESWASRIEDILTHVVMHSAYHRAQVAAALRAAGHEPTATDFIHAVREGFIE